MHPWAEKIYPALGRRKAPRAFWKRLKGKNPEGKNFRKLLRRKQSSAKISKISRNTLKSSKIDIFYLLRNLLKYLLRTIFSSAKFSEVFTLSVFPLWLFPKSEGIFRTNSWVTFAVFFGGAVFLGKTTLKQAFNCQIRRPPTRKLNAVKAGRISKLQCFPVQLARMQKFCKSGGGGRCSEGSERPHLLLTSCFFFAL